LKTSNAGRIYAIISTYYSLYLVFLRQFDLIYYLIIHHLIVYNYNYLLLHISIFYVFFYHFIYTRCENVVYVRTGIPEKIVVYYTETKFTIWEQRAFADIFNIFVLQNDCICVHVYILGNLVPMLFLYINLVLMHLLFQTSSPHVYYVYALCNKYKSNTPA
jgi:hypothetical protein